MHRGKEIHFVQAAPTRRATVTPPPLKPQGASYAPRDTFGLSYQNTSKIETLTSQVVCPVLKMQNVMAAVKKVKSINLSLRMAIG
jgi:hypothetical protein